ncbi:MAG TPA: DMT family transporter [Candidatus Binataceae bacterium]|nr:DMT family transporter [Candidatus Binataceae bacterium]
MDHEASTVSPAGAVARAEGLGRAFRIGVALAITNTIIGASQPGLTRWGAVHLDPLLFCTGAVVVAALCSAVAMLRHRELGLLIDPRFRMRIFAMSMVGSVATSLTLTFGLTRIDAIAGTILLQTEPVYSLILAMIVVGERPSARQLLATAIILVGIGSVFGARGGFTPLWAAGLVFCTPMFWQISHVMGLRMMPPLKPITVTAGRMIYAALALSAMLLATRPATLAQLANLPALGVILASGFFVYFLSSLTWYGAINRLSLAWTTALVVPGIPMLSILFAVIFLGETATRREIIGVLIAISGVLALVLGADAHRRHPETRAEYAEAAEAIHQPIT